MTAGTARTLIWAPWAIAGLALLLSFTILDEGMNAMILSLYVAIVGYIIARLFQAEIHTSLLRPNNERKEEKVKTPPPIPS